MNRQEYALTHLSLGSAAAVVIKAWNNGSDVIDILQSMNGTCISPVTTQYTSTKQAMKDNGGSRVFGGIYFQFASDDRSEIGRAVRRAPLEATDRHWNPC